MTTIAFTVYHAALLNPLRSRAWCWSLESELIHKAQRLQKGRPRRYLNLLDTMLEAEMVERSETFGMIGPWWRLRLNGPGAGDVARLVPVNAVAPTECALCGHALDVYPSDERQCPRCLRCP